MGNFVKEPEDLSGAVMVDVTVLRVCCTLWVWTMTSDGIETREQWPHNLICSLFHILIYFTFVFSYIYITADLWPRLFPCFTLHSVCVCVLAGHCSVSCWTPDLFHIKGRISQAPAIHCFYSGFLFVGLLIIVKMETQQCFNCEQSWCKLDDGNKEPLYKKDFISSPKGDNKGSTFPLFLTSFLPFLSDPARLLLCWCFRNSRQSLEVNRFCHRSGTETFVRSVCGSEAGQRTRGSTQQDWGKVRGKRKKSKFPLLFLHCGSKRAIFNSSCKQRWQLLLQ